MWCTTDGDHGRRPRRAAGPRSERARVQALEDLPDRALLVDEPAVDHAHQAGLVLVHDEVTRHSVLAAHVAIAVRRAPALIMPVAGPLQLAAPEALAQD